MTRRKSGVIAEVSRGLFEVTHESTPLEHLGQHIGRLLAGQVHSTKLRNRVIAVFEEHLFVEFFSPAKADCRIKGDITTHVEVANEFIKEQSSKALSTP